MLALVTPGLLATVWAQVRTWAVTAYPIAGAGKRIAIRFEAVASLVVTPATRNGPALAPENQPANLRRS